MSTASLCSSTLQSQINGLGSGLKFQRQNLAQPTSFTLTRYCFYPFIVLFSCEFFLGFGYFLDLKTGNGEFYVLLGNPVRKCCEKVDKCQVVQELYISVILLQIFKFSCEIVDYMCWYVF